MARAVAARRAGLRASDVKIERDADGRPRCSVPGMFVSLSHITRYTDNFTVIVVFFKPGDYDRGVEASGVCEYDFLDVFLVHGRNGSP